jgi:hypothetical protein
MVLKTPTKLLLMMLFSFAIAACGGGGSSTPTPDLTTYTISGTAISGATLSLSGTATATAAAGADGKFSFANLANGSYTVTPTLSGYAFAPTSQAATVNDADVSVPAFVATANPAPTHSISGAVSGLGAGVTVGLSPGGASTITNASGGYTFAGLADGSYTVTPMFPGYTFAPVSVLAVVNGADVSVPAFVATPNPAPTYSISGTASAGATLNLSGQAIANTTAGLDGTYTFTGLANGNYTVTPTLAGFTFTPTSYAAAVADANVSVPAFVATPNPAPTYSISGAVSGEVLPGVTISLSPGGATTTTDASGNYILSGLVNGGYTVTPSLAGKTFTPTSASATVSGTNVTGVNFVEVVPMATTGKMIFPGTRGAIANWEEAIYTQNLATNTVTDLWGGWQHFVTGYQPVFPGVIVPTRVGGKAVFLGSNIPCLMITSLSAPAPVCAIPYSKDRAIVGVFDASQNADMVAIAQGFTGPPYKQNITLFLTDNSGMFTTVTTGPDIDSSPVFANACNKNSVSCDILFVRNGTDVLMQTMNLSTGQPVGALSVFASNVVNVTINDTNGVRALTVNADFTKVAFMKKVGGKTHIFVKPKAGGAEVDLVEGSDPFWVPDGSDIIMYTVNGTRMGIKSDGTGKVQFPIPANLRFEGYSINDFPDLVLGGLVVMP